MSIRTVTGTILDPRGDPWPAFSLTFRVQPGTHTIAETVPYGDTTVTTGEDGTFAAPLVAGIRYEVRLDTAFVTHPNGSVTYPMGTIFAVVVPEGDGPVTLAALQAASGSTVPATTILTVVEAALADLSATLSDLASIAAVDAITEYGAVTAAGAITAVTESAAWGGVEDAVAGVSTAQRLDALGLSGPNTRSVQRLTRPALMADPPTRTVGTSTSVITSSVLVPWNSGSFRYLGGVPALAGASSPDNQFGRYSETTSSNVGSNMRIEFMFDGAEFEFMHKGFVGAKFRLWVDGQPVTDLRETAGEPPGTTKLVHVEFGSRANRHIRIDGTTFYFGGVRVGPTDTVWQPSNDLGPRVAFMGDSFGEGTGGDGSWVSMGGVAAEYLGWDDFWSKSVGSTGYLNPATGGKVKYRDRVQADIIADAPDIVIVQGSINDQGYGGLPVSAFTDEARLLYQAIRSGLPAAILIVITTFPMYDTTAYDAMEGAINTAAQEYADLVIRPRYAAGTRNWCTGTGRVGATTGTGNADYYRYSDAIHPSTDGHAYLGSRLASAIASWSDQ